MKGDDNVFGRVWNKCYLRENMEITFVQANTGEEGDFSTGGKNIETTRRSRTGGNSTANQGLLM